MPVRGHVMMPSIVKKPIAVSGACLCYKIRENLVHGRRTSVPILEWDFERVCIRGEL